MKIRKAFQGTIPENKILDTYSTSQTDTYSCNYINNPDFKIIQADKIDVTWSTGNNQEQKEITSIVPSTPSGYTLIGCIEAHFNNHMRNITTYIQDNKWYVDAYNTNQYGGRREFFSAWLFKKN